MKLHQINVRFVPAEDRLLLRVSTADRVEYPMWLTRRFVRRLWPILVEMAARSEPVRSQSGAEARGAVMEFAREKALQQSDFSRPYEPGAAAPAWGPAPVLLARLNARTRPDGARLLELLPEQGPGLTLELKDPLFLSFCKLLQDAVAKSGWDMELGWPGAAAAARPAGQTTH